MVISPYEVNIYRATHGCDLLARHKRLEDGKSSVKLEHVIRSLVRKPGAMLRWAHREILFPTKSFSDFYTFLKKRAEFLEREFLKSVNLIQYSQLAEIGIAMDLVMESNVSEPFEEIKKVILMNGHSPSTAITDQRLLTPDLKQYDKFISSEVLHHESSGTCRRSKKTPLSRYSKRLRGRGQDL